MTMHAASNDAALDAHWVERIRRGDEQAFAAMVRAYYTRLFDFALSITRSAPAAEDLVQDVLAHVWEHRTTWRPATTAQAYLFRAVRNRSFNYYRDDKQHVQTDLAPAQALSLADPGPDDAAHYQALVAAYRTAIEELPERRQLVFRLSRLYGLTYEEIAAVLDISINTVRTQMSAALAHLRTRLAPHLE